VGVGFAALIEAAPASNTRRFRRLRDNKISGLLAASSSTIS
jgi:hypothetical protein